MFAILYVFAGNQTIFWMKCGGLNENCSHRLRSVTARSPVSGTVWEVLGVALLEKYVTRWMALLFQRPTYSQLALCLPASCLRVRAYAVSLLLTAMMVTDLPSKNCNLPINAVFYNCLRLVSQLISRKPTKTNSKFSLLLSHLSNSQTTGFITKYITPIYLKCMHSYNAFG